MSNRRAFLKQSGLAGAGLLSTSLLGVACAENTQTSQEPLSRIREQAILPHTQQFNMCGYAAPPLENVRIGFIGVGNRGSGAVQRMSYSQGVSIQGIADVRREKAEAAKQRIQRPEHAATLYTTDENS